MGHMEIKANEKWELNKSDLLSEAPKSSHYKTMGIEPIQYIEANGLGFHEGNVIKYVSRWQHKDGLEDLKKAKFYIERLIELAQEDVKKEEEKDLPPLFIATPFNQDDYNYFISSEELGEGDEFR